MIKLKGVSKFYYSKGMVTSGFSKVNLELDKGEFVVITGESGSGKSTLLNVISGLDSYEEGEMYINGEETSHYGSSEFEEYRKRYIGNIFQDYNLVNSYTVYQNIELILRINGYEKNEIKKRVDKIIKQVNLTSHKKTKVSKLSGGQKQRVAIARALAKETDIIVADEPTGNLDSKAALEVAELLSEVSKEKLVIVVTHNFDQFEQYATRKIKMNDGKISEDDHCTAEVIRVAEEVPVVDIASTEGTPAAITESSNQKGAKTKKVSKGKQLPVHHQEMSIGSRVRIGVRNTFNVIPKFILLLLVFVFFVVSSSSQLASLKNSKAIAKEIGYNDTFTNFSTERIVLEKKDGSVFTDDDYKILRTTENIKSVAKNDVVLDTPISLQNEEQSFEGLIVRPISEFDGEVSNGIKEITGSQAILIGDEGNYMFDAKVLKDITGKDITMYTGDGHEANIEIAGSSMVKKENTNFMISGELYVTEEMMSSILKQIYSDKSKITTTVNGKEQEYVPGSTMYKVVASDKVSAGAVLGPEELNNFFEKADAKGKQLTITAQNVHYTESVSLKLSNLYNKKTFEQMTGIKDYAKNNGIIVINQADYDILFAKGNYQSSVYVKDIKELEKSKESLTQKGYIPLALYDTIITDTTNISAMIMVPITVMLLVALFFIVYFVVMLILKSRSGYFTILRMLGLDKKKIKRILDVEILLITNIAYFLYIGAVVLVKNGVIKSDYIQKLIEHMNISDFVIFYVVLLLMSWLISSKFANRLFKKTAIGTIREVE